MISNYNVNWWHNCVLYMVISSYILQYIICLNINTKRLQDQEHHHGKKTEVNQEGGGGTVQHWCMYYNGSSSTTKKSNFTSNIIKQILYLHTKESIWHRTIWGSDKNNHHLHTTRVICSNLHWASNPRGEGSVLSTSDQAYKEQQSIRRWVWYEGVWMEI